jgi:YegS/Rv2252/BmrU family lipid kinase
MKEIAIICNLTAGSGQAEKRWEKFQMELGSASIDYTVHFTEAPNHATELTKNVINNGAKRIVSFGGDGTLNEVIQGVISTSPGFRGDLELVVLGAGSSNDFDKTFEKIPWIEKIQGDKIIPIDLVRLDYINFNGESATRFFVNNSSIGVISQAGDRFNKVKGLTKIIKKISVDTAAVLAGVQTIATWNPMKVKLIVDGDTETDVTLSNLTVYKNPFIAGDMYYNRCVDRGDGKLSVALVELESKLKLMAVIPSLFTGTALDKDGTRYIECEWLELQTDHNVVIETDGEIVGHPPVRYTILKHAIHTVIG